MTARTTGGLSDEDFDMYFDALSDTKLYAEARRARKAKAIAVGALKKADGFWLDPHIRLIIVDALAAIAKLEEQG